MPATLYWEDLAPGSVRELGTTSVNREVVKEFARRYDPQPFDADEQAGRQSIFLESLCWLKPVYPNDQRALGHVILEWAGHPATCEAQRAAA